MFYSKTDLLHHEKNCMRELFSCVFCFKTFYSKFNLLRHEKICETLSKTYECNECKKIFHYKKNLHNHRKTHLILPLLKYDNQKGSGDNKQGNILDAPKLNNPKKINKTIHCHHCTAVFKNKSALYRHYMIHHNQIENQLQNLPFNLDQAPWIIDGKIDQDFKMAYEMHMRLILANHKISPATSIYNFPIDNNIDINTIMKHIEYIYRQEKNAFKVNISFGFILKNIETQRYRYFKPYTNQSILSTPFLISKKEDIQALKKLLEARDILNHIMFMRESSKYRVILISNVVYNVFSLVDYTLGGGVILPDYISRKKCIISLNRDKSKNIYNDNLCFFRCLTYHLYPQLYIINRDNFEMQAHRYFEEYKTYIQTYHDEVRSVVLLDSFKGFKGVSLSNIFLLESCFKININIYELHEDFSCSSVYKSIESFEDTMNLNNFKTHLSYIVDFQQYSLKFKCTYCTKLFKRKHDWKRHERSCSKIENVCFQGGFMKQNLTIFEELDSFSIHVPIEERFYKEFIVFDMEAMMKPVESKISNKLMWNFEHLPISVSLCTNHRDFTKPYCIVNENLDELTEEMIKYMTLIGNSIREDKMKRLESYFQELDYLGYQWETMQTNNSIELDSGQKIMMNQINRLRTHLEKYCNEVPVLGFNSGCYDINLIKGKILEHLQLHNREKKVFVIKRNNCYSCISNGDFKFLDVTHFLSPGTTYAQFLKAFGVSQRKGFFPYEYFRKSDQLQETKLPPMGEAWFSSLKGRDILHDGENTVASNYRWLQEVWQNHNMRSLKDFLIWYNNLDVGPFVEALIHLTEFYFKRNIDIFKDTVSVPGIARKMLYQAAKNKNVSFSLIDKDDSSLYYLIMNNIVGGPSIIFNRFHKKNETFIRNNENFPCKTIIGYDANSLYLWAIDQKMPTGGYIRRMLSDNFTPRKNTKYEDMFYWMDWLNLTQGLNILHYRNFGSEKRVGPFYCDGFDVNIKSIFQYHGCWYHGHSCLSKNLKTFKDIQLHRNRNKSTHDTTNFMKSQGYRVVEIYECEFKKMKQENPALRKFISQHVSPFTNKYPSSVNEDDIIQGVMWGEIFGMLEVDISVPDSWSEVCFRPDTNLNPQEYFGEMSPIFGNVDITFDDIGPLMQEYINENNLSKRPRRLLIGAMRAEKILLATPLLIWYIKHGLKITKIHQVIEYNSPSYCFSEFVNNVSSARREGDLNPDKSVIADTFKLIGNSAFGSTIQNKLRHKDISYVKGFEEASKAINTPLFDKLSEISRDYYEIEKFKRKYQLNLPIQVGYFILQYAKLRMLQFYYDFFDRYLDRTTFQALEMDTDSLYLAMSDKNIINLIKPSMKEEYIRSLNNFCSDDITLLKENEFFFPRMCCNEHNRYDQRTPGLFKTEFQGDEMINLASKTYIIVSEGKTKMSSKGINKHTIDNPLDLFRNVLKHKKSEGGVNVGFRINDNKIFTYTQDKKAFSYLYCKRKVLDCGIQTEPLDITIRPKSTKEQ
jgi:hypothetical protein